MRRDGFSPVEVRPAQATDQDAIRSLVRRERLNPNGLHWRHFVVASLHGELAGAVQLRRHPDGSRELGSLVVRVGLRGQGIAAVMIDALLHGEPGPVHMITNAPHAAYYARWGFRAIEPRHAPPRVRRNHLMGRIARVLSFIKGLPPRTLVILQRDPAASRQSPSANGVG